MKIHILSVTLFYTITTFAQPAIQWEHNYGGSKAEYAYSVIQTNDKGYAFAGYSQSDNMDIDNHHGTIATKDYWVVKLDSTGAKQWQKSLGGTQDDIAYSIIQTKDGGFVVAGLSQSNDGDITGHHGTISNADYWIVKLDASGVLQWQKSLGGTYWDEARSVVEMKSGNLLVAGTTQSNDYDVIGIHGQAFYSSDYWVAKLNPANGNIIWKKCFGGSQYEYAYDLTLSTSGGKDAGCIIAGVSGSTDGDITNPKGGYDYWVIKVDTLGSKVWQKALGGSGSDVARAVIEDNNGDVVLTGRSGSNDMDITAHRGSFNVSDYWVVKMNSSGTSILWEKSLGGSGEDEAWDIKQTTEGGYVIGGSSASNDGDVSAHYGSAGINDQWLIKLDHSGAAQWQKSYGGSASDDLYSIDICVDGSAVTAGGTMSSNNDVSAVYGAGDCWIVKLDATVTAINEQVKNINTLALYPNPVADNLNIVIDAKASEKIQVQINNMLGELVFNEIINISSGESRFLVSAEQFAKGVYTIRLAGQTGEKQTKFVKY